MDTTQLNNLFTLNPTTVLTVRYGFNRFPNYSYESSQGYDLASLGFSAGLVNQVPKALSQFPYVSMSNLMPLGASDNNSFYVHASDNFSTNIAKYVGRHNLKAGFDYREIKAAGNDANNAAGDYTFNGIFTKSAPTSFWRRRCRSGRHAAGLSIGRRRIYFHQTDRCSPTTTASTCRTISACLRKLTLNMGMRWEHETGLQEVNNGMLVNFDGTAANPLAAGVTGIAPKGVIDLRRQRTDDCR